MNKTISINIGGAVFNIEEDAFQVLKSYLDRIKINFASDASESEIMADIEGRIAELFSQKMNDSKNVVVLKDVEEVIAVMGQPEDYATETSENGKTYSTNTQHDRRRVYRDEDDAMIGGVASGLSYLLGWDPIILRAIFVGLIFTGSGILAYLILWAVIPSAKTTAEKLKMRGEPVTVDNISKFVSQEAKAASERVNKWGEKVSSKTNSVNMRRASSGLSVVLRKVIGVAFILFSIFSLIGLMTGAFVANLELFGANGNLEFLDKLLGLENGMMWMVIIGVGLAIVSPLLGILYAGVRLLVDNSKRVKGLGFTLVLLFVGGIIMAIWGGGNIGRQFRRQGEVTNTIAINVLPSDTLEVNVMPDTIFTGRSQNVNHDLMDLVKMESDRVIYGANVRFNIYDTEDGEQARFELERHASGSSLIEAGERASRIEYEYEWTGKVLTLEPYFSTPASDPFRAQEVEVRLYLPKGTKIKLNENVDLISWIPTGDSNLYVVE